MDVFEGSGETEAVTEPYLFDLSSCVNAPSLVLSRRDGQIEEDGVQGWMYAERRCLSRLHVTVNGLAPVGLAEQMCGAAGATFRAVVPGLGAAGDDPTVLVGRRRDLGHEELVETVSVRSVARPPLRVVLAVVAGSDLSTMAEVRTARARPARAPRVEGHGLAWDDGRDSVLLRADPEPDELDVPTGTMVWARELRAGESLTVRLRLLARPGRSAVFAPGARVPWSRPDLACADRRVPQLVHQGLTDLEGLLLRDEKGGREDHFLAAGSPWFMTLYGRDSLWAARFLLPLGTDLAMSTLRALARHQGSRDDPETSEQPGRIPHEVRATPLVLKHVTLPPRYYGTADATQLFVICCAEAWRWGADPDEVRELLPAVEGCLAWMREQAGDGFISYLDATGRGLSNQGWKDTPEAIQCGDGSPAKPPVALSEVQAYAYQAAALGADLLEGFGRSGADGWRTWATSLAERFREAFWVEDAEGPFPAVALDVDGAPADSPASNMGHLVGTGLLDHEEAVLVARRLLSPDLSSGFGLRTLSTSSPRFSPLAYHGGAVWPHDTAIAVIGLAREGLAAEAGSLFRGLLRAAPAFGFRLPELFGGDSADEVATPTPWPAACRPQAWAAAAPVGALVALLGLEVDVPQARVAARPMLPQTLLPLSVSGLRLGRHDLQLEVDGDGTVRLGTDLTL